MGQQRQGRARAQPGAPARERACEALSLERLEDNLFRGQSRDIGTKYVFGGQVLGQALSAAQADEPLGNYALMDQVAR